MEVGGAGGCAGGGGDGGGSEEEKQGGGGGSNKKKLGNNTLRKIRSKTISLFSKDGTGTLPRYAICSKIPPPPASLSCLVVSQPYSFHTGRACCTDNTMYVKLQQRTVSTPENP